LLLAHLAAHGVALARRASTTLAHVAGPAAASELPGASAPRHVPYRALSEHDRIESRLTGFGGHSETLAHPTSRGRHPTCRCAG
jgi:hypothetical protein